jgi:hypothetical protein
LTPAFPPICHGPSQKMAKERSDHGEDAQWTRRQAGSLSYIALPSIE